MILLDTDICIELLRGNRSILDRREREAADVAVTFMTAGELFYGAARSSKPDANRERVERFLLTVGCVETDREIMRRFGEEKARREAQGHRLPDADILIAAAALRHNARLVSGNLKHFRRFPGLPAEDWSDRAKD